MVSLQQEEIPLTAEDAELPEMVPVSIRSALPELQHCPLERVLAGLLLTWKEFLQLFDIRVEASDYFIRGSNGSKSDLNQKIGDYVSTFRRKLKIYPVTLERVAEVSEMAKGQRGTASSEGSNPNKMVDNNRASGSGTAPKKLKLMDEDKRKRNHRKMTKESLEKIAQSVIKEQSAAAPKRNSGKKGESKRDANKSRSSTPPSTINMADGPSTSSDLLSLGTVQQGALNVQSTGGKLKRLSTDHSQVKDIVPSSSAGGIVKRGRKPRKSRTLSSRTLSSRRSSTKLSIHSANTGVEESNDEEDSVDSNDDVDDTPTKGKNKLLKQNVVKFFQEKVSPRTLLTLRDELLGLRDQEKYFKVTSVVPMSAGLLEQAFCRKLTE